jgi:hypothetical protein
VKSYRDLWLWLGAALLTASAGLLAIALAYFTKVQEYSLFTSWWMLATTIVFLLAFACFYSAIKGVAFPPWEEPVFPKIKVDIYGASHVAVPRSAMGRPVEPLFIWFYRVHIINLEKEQNASLIIRPFFGLVPDGPGPFAETAATHANLEQLEMLLSLSPGISFAPNPLPETILLSPATSASGDLVYMVSTFSWQKLAQPRQVRLVIEDLVSGKAMEKVIDEDWARFTTKDMSPAKPGLRMLEEDKLGEVPGSPIADEARLRG